MMEIEEMEIEQIYNFLVERLEHERERCCKNGHTVYGVGKQEKLDQVIGILQESLTLYKKELVIDVRYV